LRALPAVKLPNMKPLSRNLRRASAIGWCLLALLYSPAAAESGLENRDVASAIIDVYGWADYYEGAPASLGIDQITSPDCSREFIPVRSGDGLVMCGVSVPSTWIRFSLPREKLDAFIKPHLDSGPAPRIQWVLVLKPSFSIILNYADLYIPLRSGGYKHIAAGSMRPRRPYEAASKDFVFELPDDAFDGRPLYIRVASSRDVKIDLVVMPALAESPTRTSGTYGAIYGILAAMLVYGLFLLITFNDRAYFYYICYIFSLGLWLFYVQGHSKLYFGTQPGFAQTMLWFSAGSFIGWSAIFSASFLELRKSQPAFYFILIFLGALGLVTAAAGLAQNYSLAFRISTILGIILPIVIFTATIIRLIQGFSAAQNFLVGWFLLLVAGLAFTLMSLQVLPVNYFTANIMGLAASVQSVFIALALTNRFRRMEAEREILVRSQARYRELSLTDVLTGLRNKRCLNLKLDEAIIHSVTRGTPLSLIFLDIDDFKKVNDTFGHAMGDEVLVHLANSIRSCVRVEDTPCRYGGEEFVIVMPNTKLDDAYLVSERLRENFEAVQNRTVHGVCVPATISLGVAQYMPGERADTFIGRADRAMYEAKRQGKNRSVIELALQNGKNQEES